MTELLHQPVERRGCRLVYDLRGDGPPVLWLQGVGVHGDGWLPQIDVLRARFACLSFDNRGMGRSQPPAIAITVEAMAADALAILDHAGWVSAHVVGHSLGGVVAQAVAVAAPERVRSLALVCTFARGKDVAPLTWRMITCGLRSRVGPRRQRRRGFLSILFPPGQPPRAEADARAVTLAPFFGHDLADPPPIEAAQLRALRAADLTPRLVEIDDTPTLIVACRHDPIAPPAAGRHLAAALPRARYLEVADASHGWPITHVDDANRLLGEHLDEAERRWTSR